MPQIYDNMYFTGKCDGVIDCTDGSDEFGFCDEDELTCDCLTNKQCHKCNGCINKTSAVERGFIECPELRITYGRYGKVNIYRLDNILQCNEIGFPKCDNSTCYTFSYLSSSYDKHAAVSYQSCTSFCSDHQYCHKKPAFQCSDNSYIFLDHFCDGVVDCVDGSDEFVNKPGFKCNQCVLPQNNLYDDLAQCNDDSDLCLFANNDSCFQCLDKRLLISSKQVCDGVYDCYDLSDECLCDVYFHAEMCARRFELNDSACFETKLQATSHSSLKIHTTNSPTRILACQTKYGLVQAKPCDGRPECKDFRDECECKNPPTFCYDPCGSFVSMGDRYCDGVEDQAWIHLNVTQCPKGFDELQCPKRFRCKASGKVSIDDLQVCDGKPDCDDGSDESNCNEAENAAIFSSDTEMISEPAIKAAFWIMGFIVLFGNVYVFHDTNKALKEQRVINVVVFQRIILLNISIADFIMGVYLITIAAYSQAYSGIYGSVDREWRSSSTCSFIGSLSLISGEASCFFMVVLTGLRLMIVYEPIKSSTSSMRLWKLCTGIIATWLLSILLSIIPIAGAPSYFVHSISFSSKFYRNGSIDVAELKQFMCRYALLSNTTIKDHGNELESIEMFFKSNLPESLPVRMFGYYGETSVCLPRLYVAHGEPSWEYSIFVISLNLLCFIFIAVGYIFIYKRSVKMSAVGKSRSEQQAATIQKRIARIIVTDFCCWIPICIMAYVRLTFNFSNIAYHISAAFLLPINSALNPFLFSSLPDKLLEFCGTKLQKSCKCG